MENNKHDVSTAMLEQLADVLGVEPVDILGGKLTITIQEQKGSQSGRVVINNNSDKALASLEARVKDLEEKLALVIALHGKSEK